MRRTRHGGIGIHPEDPRLRKDLCDLDLGTLGAGTPESQTVAVTGGTLRPVRHGVAAVVTHHAVVGTVIGQ